MLNIVVIWFTFHEVFMKCYALLSSYSIFLNKQSRACCVCSYCCCYDHSVIAVINVNLLT